MKYYIFVIVLSISYIVLSMTNPISSASNAYGLSPITIRFLQFTIGALYSLSWLAGTAGSVELNTSAESTPDTAKKSAFKKKAMGVAILIGGSIITAFISTIRSRVSPDPSNFPGITILLNYVYVFVPLIGLSYLASGAFDLSKSIDAKPPKPYFYVLAFVFCTLAVGVNAYLLFTREDTTSSYFLPEALVVMTILLPSFITWIIGTVGVITSFNYIGNVQGVVYKAGLGQFNAGIFFVVLTSMFLQLLLSVGSSRLLGISLGGILLIVYTFIILQAVGYLLIAFGSRKLTTVESILSKYTKRI